MRFFPSQFSSPSWILLFSFLAGCSRTTQGGQSDDDFFDDSGAGGFNANVDGSGGLKGGSGGSLAAGGALDGAGGALPGAGGAIGTGSVGNATGGGALGGGAGGTLGGGGTDGSGSASVGGNGSGGGSPLVTCAPNQYRTGGPTEAEGGACEPLTVCGAGDYESTPPTATSDRECSPVPDCQSGQTISCAQNGAQGNCAGGIQVCGSDGKWGPCSIQPEPKDSCVGGDDANCNNQITENCGCITGNMRSCSDAQGACSFGTQVCATNGTWGACSVQPAPNDSCAVAGDDSDCDGFPNSGCLCTNGQQTVCGPPAEVGICRFGLSTCTGNAFGTCENAIYAQGRNCASALDNDCNGIADNTIDTQCQCLPGTSQACDGHGALDGNGPCTAGTRTCQTSVDGTTSFWSACTGSVGPAMADSCSVEGDDSDCDGTENGGCACITGSGTSCADQYGSLGVCGEPNLVCALGGQWPAESVCDSMATVEMCGDLIDNNCDGDVDEASVCPCTAAPCENGGVCHEAGGLYSCDCDGTGFIGGDCEQPVALTLTSPLDLDCQAVALSDDGTTLAATCSSGAAPLPYAWSASGGWAQLQLPVGYSEARLVGMSANGQSFAGVASESGETDVAVRWNTSTGIPVVLPSTGTTTATQMSGDGQSVAGEDTVGLLVWTGDSTATSYDTSTDNAAAKLSAITFDGSELFGGSDAAGIVNWTAATAPTAGWVALSGEVLTTKATSSDGTVIVGVGTDPSESTNEIPWTYDGVDLVWLDDLAIGTGVICDVGGIDASGSWIAGHCDGVPAVWEAGVGSTIADIVSSQSGDPTVGLSGQARAISADGSTVAGDDGSEVFLVRLP